MTEAPAPKTSRLAALRSALEQGSMRHGQRMINSMHPAEIASLIESLPPAKREIVWEFVDPEIEGDVLIELNEEVRAELIGGMDAEELIAATEGMEVDDLADLIGDLPETLNERVLRSMDAQDRERLSAVLRFEEDSAGGLMNLDAVTVRPDVTLEVVLRYLRMRGELPDRTDRLFVVNRHDKYLGGLDITRLLTEDPEQDRRRDHGFDPRRHRAGNPGARGREAVRGPRPRVGAGRQQRRQAARPHHDRRRGRRHPRRSRSLGHEHGRPRRRRGHVRRRGARARGVARSGSAINLATAFLAANVVGLFEATIEKVVALAVLMPIVASMGGIAGSQTLVLIIRGLALGQIETGECTLAADARDPGGTAERRGAGRRRRRRCAASGSTSGRSAGSSSRR